MYIYIYIYIYINIYTGIGSGGGQAGDRVSKIQSFTTVIKIIASYFNKLLIELI